MNAFFIQKSKADILRYRLPLKHPISLKQRSLDQREGLILKLYAGGRFGYGEIAPLPGFSRESIEEAEVQLQVFVNAVNEGRFDVLAVNDFVKEAFLEQFSIPSVLFGIESALWWLNQDDWVSPQSSAPLLLGPIEQILLRLEQWEADGPEGWPKEFKLKTGRDSLEEDCSRIRQVLNVLPDSVSIKLDANQRWSLPQALWLASSIDTRRIAYVEEPTANTAEFSGLYEKAGLPFALDETIQSADFQLQPMPGLVAIVIKPTLVGGLRRCQDLVNAARTQGIRAIFSSSYESPIGLHVLQQLSALWTPEELPGLDTASAFTHSLLSEEIAAGSPVSINSVFCPFEEKS